MRLFHFGIVLVALCKMCEVHFNLHGTSGFHVKAENEKFIPACAFCRQNFILEKFTLSFGRLRQKIAPKSVLQDVLV